MVLSCFPCLMQPYVRWAQIITCTHAASKYCFCRHLCLCICASVCVSVCTKSWKLLIRNWCNLVGICPMVKARSVWKLVIFDLDFSPWDIFPNFSNSSSFECLKLAASFSAWRYILEYLSHLRVSRSSVNCKVMVAKQWQHAGLCSLRTQFNWLCSLARWWNTAVT